MLSSPNHPKTQPDSAFSRNAPLARALRDLSLAAISLSALGLSACSGSASAKPEAAGAGAASAQPQVAAASQIDAGRYLVKLGGCNDCHTPGYVESNGAAPVEAQWLTGSSTGYAGPWGVSYPPNLRLSFQNMDEEQFLELAHAGKGRPPMPWPSLMAMSDTDLKAIYAYIHSLGAAGLAAPHRLDPGQKPKDFVIHLTP